MNDTEFIEFLCRQIRYMNEENYKPDIKTIVIELNKRNIKYEKLLDEE